eukprot:jgi/Psemu1/26387/gm1.26387_g
MLTSTLEDFIPTAAKSTLGESPWSMVGNPGLWDQYCFRPKFHQKKEGKYLHHQLPSGKCNNWDFYYTGWIPEDDEPAYSRRHVLPSVVESESLFPSERKGLLNMRKLKLHGLTKKRLILGGRQIKANLKLNCNLEAQIQMAECKQQDISTFNYAYKFDYIYEALAHNTQYFTEKAGDNLCMNKKTS